jgi:hypothetical protein
VPRPHAPRTRVSTYLSDWMPTGDETRNGVAGYFAGGTDGTNYLSVIDRLAFPSDTKTTGFATLTAVSGEGMGGMANSGVAGYVHLAYNSSSFEMAVMNKITFSTDTVATTTSLSGVRRGTSGMANSGVAGYIC